ncbi:MAG: hypothetical protein R3C14_29195 [Caldilineaceae bacterium]
MRTLWQISSRTFMILAAAAVIVGGLLAIGNRSGGVQSAPVQGETVFASSSADGAQVAQPPAGQPSHDREFDGGHDGANLGFGLLGVAQSTAIIMVIVLVITGGERLLNRRKTTSAT